jgi:hypothetical protein
VGTIRSVPEGVMMFRGLGLVVLIYGVSATPTAQRAQQPAPAHITIPALANASKPSDLDYQAGECDIDEGGGTMECAFQQVFLTISLLDKKTCLITTNRYARTFHKEAAARWVSREQPQGPCGVVELTTLENEGGTRWTMEMRKIVNSREASPGCGRVDQTPETLTWRNLRRSLPCTSVQPGAMSR